MWQYFHMFRPEFKQKNDIAYFATDDLIHDC